MKYRVIASSLMTLGALLAQPSVVGAQDRGFVSGQFGVTFQSETAPVFGVEAGGNFAPAVAVYGTFGRMQNALPKDIQDVLDLLGSGVDASLPVTYAMGGVRAGAPNGAVRPYVAAGVGIAHLGARFEFLGQNITRLVEEELDETLTSNELAFEFGAGVTARIGTRGFVDAGYRYVRINTSDINVSRAYGGIGLRF